MTMTPEEKLAPVSQAQPPEHLALAREDRDAALIEQLNERAKLIVELLQMIRFGNQGFAGGIHIQRARRIIDGLPEAIAEGEANYRAYCLASPDHVHEGTLEELATCARMLDEYGIKEMPANEKGQIEFNRALMESTVGAINAYIVNHRQATEARMQERVRAETERCAMIADKQAGAAKQERLAKGRRYDPDDMIEILAEERGERIACQIIAAAIRETPHAEG